MSFSARTHIYGPKTVYLPFKIDEWHFIFVLSHLNDTERESSKRTCFMICIFKLCSIAIAITIAITIAIVRMLRRVYSFCRSVSLSLIEKCKTSTKGAGNYTKNIVIHLQRRSLWKTYVQYLFKGYYALSCVYDMHVYIIKREMMNISCNSNSNSNNRK